MEEKGENRPPAGSLPVDFMASSLLREPWKAIKAIKPDKGKVKLTIGDQYSYVEAEKPNVFRDLEKSFTFLNPSFWFMKSRFGSPARARFLTQTQFITKAGRFPTGLLEDVLGKVRQNRHRFLISSPFTAL